MRTTEISIDLVNALRETLKQREIRIVALESSISELSEIAVKLLNAIVDSDQSMDPELLKNNCLRIIELQNETIAGYDKIIQLNEEKIKDLRNGK